MATSTPASGPLPGPFGELVRALRELHARAGLPSRRKISYDIRQRHDLRDTVSHETVSAMLRGEARPSWLKYETVVRYLAEYAVYQPNEQIPDQPTLIARFHRLWLACDPGNDTEPEAPPVRTPPPEPEPHQPAAQSMEEIGGDPPPRNPRFVGREHQLRAIHEILRTGAPILTLTGIGGVGKTQLAAEYVYRFRDEYDVIWWVPAEHASPMRASLAELGERLGLPRSGAMQHPPVQVLEALGTCGLHWLLVLDNARAPRRMPIARSWGSGKMLLTSRDPEWTDTGPTIDIDVFTREESVALLRERASMRERDADTVAEKLGDLPLAVDQVANWHTATGTPVASYLDRFDQQVREILADPAALGTGYPATVASFLTYAMDQLSASSPTAAQLLELFGWLGAEPVPLDLLRRGRLGAVSPLLRAALQQEPLLNQAVLELRRHGLVSIRERPATADPAQRVVRSGKNPARRIQVHRLFQRVLRDRLTPERLARGRDNVHGILAAANPGEPDDPQFWHHYEAVGPHIQSADLGTAKDFEVRRAVLDQARYLYRVGHYEESRSLSQQLVDMVEGTAAGDVSDHNFAVLAQLHLANASRVLGNYTKAGQLVKRSADYMRQHPVFGPDHDYHAIVDNTRALDLRIAGDYEHALKHDEKSLTRHHPDDLDKVWTSRNNIAVNYRLLGRFADAHRLDEELVAQWRDVQRRERDPRALLARVNLARDLYGLGRYGQARDILRATLPVYREVVGDKHHNILLANRTMVTTLRKLGAVREALAQAQENHDDVTLWLDPGYNLETREYNHEFSLAAGISLVNAYLATGDLGNATLVAKPVLTSCARVLGDDHPMTLAMLVDSAAVLRALGDLAEARRRDEHALGRLRAALGDHHPFTLCANHNFATDLVLVGHEGRAHDELKAVCARSGQLRGDDHPDSIAAVVNRALVWSVIGGRQEDHPDLARAVAALEHALGAGHPQVLAAQERRWLECDIEPPPT